MDKTRPCTHLALIVMLAGLGACATVQGARDRIVKRQPVCADQTAQIYFEPDSAEITKEGRAVLSATGGAVSGCRVVAVDVLGLADAAGAPADNLELSKRRAQAVAAALSATGLPAAEFKVSAAGQAGATTPGGKAQPLRRRVDIVMRFRPG